jgi:hypothetical protein
MPLSATFSLQRYPRAIVRHSPEAETLCSGSPTLYTQPLVKQALKFELSVKNTLIRTVLTLSGAFYLSLDGASSFTYCGKAA